MAEGISRESIIQAMENATAKIVSKIPWLGEHVVHEGKAPGNTGTFKLAQWPPDAPPNNLIRVRDCTELCPSRDEILQAKGPTSMLDGKIICPVPGFPLTYDGKIGPAPAVIMQVNWIEGGLLLTFSNQHNVMDATGMFQFIALLSTVMCGEAIPESAIEQGNRDRKTVAPLLVDGQDVRNHSPTENAFPLVKEFGSKRDERAKASASVGGPKCVVAH